MRGKERTRSVVVHTIESLPYTRARSHLRSREKKEIEGGDSKMEHDMQVAKRELFKTTKRNCSRRDITLWGGILINAGVRLAP